MLVGDFGSVSGPCAGRAILGTINESIEFIASCILTRNGVQRNGCLKDCASLFRCLNIRIRYGQPIL